MISIAEVPSADILRFPAIVSISLPSNVKLSDPSICVVVLYVAILLLDPFVVVTVPVVTSVASQGSYVWSG